MVSLASPVPQICISPAPAAEPVPEPFSPFDAQFSPSSPSGGEDPYRASLLSPPPTVSPRFHRQPSPLRPADAAAGKGLEQERFQALLAATRERNSTAGGKRVADLRKEIALKAHKSKQSASQFASQISVDVQFLNLVERRAMFLSKLTAPPSPSATMTPKTPPESPAIFHFTLPTPGLVSPLAMFEALDEEDGSFPNVQPWVEQVDYRVRSGKQINSPSPRRTVLQPANSQRLPSLDQITARLSTQKQATVTKDEPGSRLPAFLRSGSPPRRSSPELAKGPAPAALARVAKPAPKLPPPALDIPPMPVSPSSPVSPNLQITTTVVPRLGFVLAHESHRDEPVCLGPPRPQGQGHDVDAAPPHAWP
ncbi:hypothetical protein EVG20_g6026 [Dentipellis fragilis]|uniref:Uncharacterized protein n=1 Tax=Dentipellis fragilis TaxID=205917 RepID=A0A4Y9YQZ9_9AGAM|nr:hypothetical protein EVG20_g6026 [Dentipellis fragilis]